MPLDEVRIYDGETGIWSLPETVSRLDITEAVRNTFWEPKAVNGYVYYQTFENHIYQRRWRGTMDNTFRLGRLVVEFPATPNYAVQVRVEGRLVGDSYSVVTRRGAVNEDQLTEAEIVWLTGFGDEVAAHDAAFDAVVSK